MSELIKNIQLKKANGIELLYNQYGKKLYGYAVKKWNVSEDDAWDLIYKTLYRVLDVIDNYSFENEQKFAGFVFTIFVNYLRNHYRDEKSKRVEVVELNEQHEKQVDDGDATKEEQTATSLHMNHLQDELEKLDDWQRILLLMRAQDYSYEEIGKYVEKPSKQLKVYYLRLKNTITERINKRLNG